MRSRRSVRLLVVVLAARWVAQAGAEGLLVKDGKPQAVIVLSGTPARMAKLAAAELRTYVKEISGAELPIRTQPDKAFPVTVYVCRQRVRTNGTELSAWSPTGQPHFNVPRKFGKVWSK